jgi:hypothetical protein
MVSVCAWCEKYLGVKEPLDSLEVSHGICSACKARQQLEEPPTLVISKRRADALPVLASLLQGTPAIPVVVDRRSIERRRERPSVDIPGGRRMLRDRRRGTDIVVV